MPAKQKTQSGAAWCDRFPTSASIDDCVEPFRSGLKAFVAELKRAGATVTISATYRPAERAYLMHWACKIAQGTVKAADVPAMTGVDIDWVAGGVAGAKAMVAKYNIAYPAALVSRHTQKRAVDMTIAFRGAITVTDKAGKRRTVHTKDELFPIGATYGVVKLVSDPPHWSDDGH